MPGILPARLVASNTCTMRSSCAFQPAGVGQVNAHRVHEVAGADPAGVYALNGKDGFGVLSSPHRLNLHCEEDFIVCPFHIVVAKETGAERPGRTAAYRKVANCLRRCLRFFDRIDHRDYDAPSRHGRATCRLRRIRCGERAP